MTELRRKLRTFWESRPRFGKAVHFVSDNAGWAIEGYARHTVSGLRRHTTLPARHVTDIPDVRDQIVHFADRYRFLDQCSTRLTDRNDVFVTWFHGGMEQGFDETMTRLRSRVGEIRGVVTSCSLGKEALEQGGIPSEKLTVIPLGVDTRLFRPATAEQRSRIRAELGVPAGAVCLGSFQKDGVGWGDGDEPKLIKGPDVFVEVAVRLQKRIPQLFVLLTGPARGYVKRRLRDAGVPYIHHVATSHEALPQYYQALDLYVIGSRCEGGPLALVESWATGCPVVATRVGVAADSVRDGENGLVRDVDDVDGLVDGAERVATDSDFARSLRDRAAEDVRAFDWGILACRYHDELYAPLARQPMPSGRSANCLGGSA